MPKQKTHKGTKKRFRLTATGKAKHKTAGNSHLASRKSHKRKRKMRCPNITDESMTPNIQEALGKHSY